MTKPRAFGRRTEFEKPVLRPAPVARPSYSNDLIRPPEIILQPSPDASCMSVEDELREWKKSRDRGFHIPWRQLSLMAGLSFGIASFVLPDSINDVVQWPLYALSAASFYAGFRKRRKQSSPSATVPK
jgi:hypothetical protein